MNTTEIKQQLSEGVKIVVKDKYNRIINLNDNLIIFNGLKGNNIPLESYKDWERNIFTLKN